MSTSEFHTPVRFIKGVGEKREKLFNKLGVFTAGDLLYLLPRSYIDLSCPVKLKDAVAGEENAVLASIQNTPKKAYIKRNFSIVRLKIGDDTGDAAVTFFNQPYMADVFHEGDMVWIYGKAERKADTVQFQNPMMKKTKDGKPEHPMLPVYPLTAGLTQNILRKAIGQLLRKISGYKKEIFTNAFRTEHNLCEINYAFSNIHFPRNNEALEKARRRLLFEELMLFSAMLDRLETVGVKQAPAVKADRRMMAEFLDMLPFLSTAAQKNVMETLIDDFNKGKPMNRLLQGDVGAGKTVVAFFLMYVCAKNGLQCAMMAPTEVLAVQHFKSAVKLFRDAGFHIVHLTGTMKQKKKNAVCAEIKEGRADVVIGTHALLYDAVSFENLGIVITDEQHRFGVAQRAAAAKKRMPHTLIMSATPIPRTLALILYGKTDISILDEMPPGRKRVKTHFVPPEKRGAMYAFIEAHIKKGERCFVICALIEKNEQFPAKSVEEVYEEIKERFGAKQTAVLHGRLKSEEKRRAIAAFSAGEKKILVSTTVVEVGVDVAGATMMVIENAERFGLSQLHQLRGRVGRNEKQSYCFLLTESGDMAERLKILTKTNDGFQIAEKDLMLRGPGQFLGEKQHGLGDLYMTDLIRDVALLSETKKIYVDLKNDPSKKEELKKIDSASRMRFYTRMKNITMN